MSPSLNRPVRCPRFAFGTVLILSTIKLQDEANPLPASGTSANRNSGASVGSVVQGTTVTDAVPSKRSDCRITAGLGLPA